MEQNAVPATELHMAPHIKIPVIITLVVLFLIIAVAGWAVFSYVYNSPKNVLKRVAQNYMKSLEKTAYNLELDAKISLPKDTADAVALFGLGDHMSGHISSTIAQQIKSKEDIRFDIAVHSLQLKLSDLMEFTLYPDFELRAVNTMSYFRIGNLPQQLSSFSSYKNQWYSMEFKKNNITEPPDKTTSTTDAENNKLAEDLIDKYNVLGITQQADETIDKVITRHYVTIINRNNLLVWFQNSYKPLMLKHRQTENSLASDEAMLKQISLSKSEFWVGPGDNLKRVLLGGTYTDKSYKLEITTNVTVIPFNSDSIEPPKDSKPFRSPYNRLIPSSLPTYAPYRHLTPIRYPSTTPVPPTKSATQNCEYIKQGLGKYYTSQQYSQCLQQQSVLGAWIKKIL